MHISDGVLPAPVVAAGWALTILLLAVTISLSSKKSNISEQIPKLSVITGAFFVASLVNVPVPPTSVHLILNGLVGVTLGLLAFPSIFVGLTLQALLFQHGGVTTIGINTLNMGVPALLACGIFKAGAEKGILKRGVSEGVFGALAGGTAVILSTLFLALSLFSAGEAFTAVAKVVAASHIPIIIIEAVITGAVVSFLAKVKPELLPLDTEV